MSPTMIAGWAVVLSQVLPFLHIAGVSDSDITITIKTLVAIGAGIFVIVRRFLNGGVNIFGKRV